jgi:hypothetical protein
MVSSTCASASECPPLHPHAPPSNLPPHPACPGRDAPLIPRPASPPSTRAMGLASPPCWAGGRLSPQPRLARRRRHHPARRLRPKRLGAAVHVRVPVHVPAMRHTVCDNDKIWENMCASSGPSKIQFSGTEGLKTNPWGQLWRQSATTVCEMLCLGTADAMRCDAMQVGWVIWAVGLIQDEAGGVSDEVGGLSRRGGVRACAPGQLGGMRRHLGRHPRTRGRLHAQGGLGGAGFQGFCARPRARTHRGGGVVVVGERRVCVRRGGAGGRTRRWVSTCGAGDGALTVCPHEGACLECRTSPQPPRPRPQPRPRTAT